MTNVIVVVVRRRAEKGHNLCEVADADIDDDADGTAL